MSAVVIYGDLTRVDGGKKGRRGAWKPRKRRDRILPCFEIACCALASGDNTQEKFCKG